MRLNHLIAFAAIALVVGYWVYRHPRLQRFTNLNENYVEERIHRSVNENFLNALWDYPLGNGLGGGGTSIPYFLRDRLKNPVAIENEYGRILLEIGIPGLCIWVAFLIAAIGGAESGRTGPWAVGWRLARVTCALSFGTAFHRNRASDRNSGYLPVVADDRMDVRAEVQSRPGNRAFDGMDARCGGLMAYAHSISEVPHTSQAPWVLVAARISPQRRD